MTFSASDFTSNSSAAQASRTATQLNSMRPVVADRFAAGIEDFNAQHAADGYSVSVTEGFRSNQRSDELRASGIQAASGGNSWHNYGAAGDVVLFKDGQPVWNDANGEYSGILRESFAKHGLHNNQGANDLGHFQPVETPRGVPSDIKNGSTTIEEYLGAPPNNTPTPAEADAVDELPAPAEQAPDVPVRPVADFKPSGVTPNWYSTVDSPTYKLTLYVVHPNTFNNPTMLADDQAVINRGDAVIISQSGVTRYAIDNLVMMSSIIPTASSSFASTGIFQFNIYEPLGFSLLDRISALGPSFGFLTMAEAKYVLKIEFLGLDATSALTKPYNGSYFYPFKINNISATSGAEGTTYDVVAANITQTAMLEAQVEMDVGVEGVNTVNDFLSNLEFKLNEYERDLREGDRASLQNIKEYRVRLGNNVKSSSLMDGDVSVNNFDLGQSSFSTVGSSGGTGAGTSMGSNDVDLELRDTTITANSNIAEFIRDRLKKNVPSFNTHVKTNLEENGIHPVIIVTPKIEYSPELDDSTLTSKSIITFEVDIYTTFSTVKMDSLSQLDDLGNATRQQEIFRRINPYIVKKYDYLYTGENTEVLNFDLQFQQLFYVPKDPARAANYDGPASTAGASTLPKQIDLSNITFISQIKPEINLPFETPQYMFTRLSADEQQQVEAQGEDTDYVVSTRAQEYFLRENDFVNTEIEIKGDPFWMGSPGSSFTGSESDFNEYYGYETHVSFITFNPSEEFVSHDNPSAEKRMELGSSGLYRVMRVENRLANGKFTQKLTLQKNRNFNSFYIQNNLLEL